MENSSDYIFYGSDTFKFQCFVVNQTANKKDNRSQVQQPHRHKLFKCIGKILAYFDLKQSEQNRQQGTAFLIGQRILLTCAHNVYNCNNQEAKIVYFYPAQSDEQKRIRIKVKQFQKADEFVECKNQLYGPNVYDIALLELQQQNQNGYRIPKDYLHIKYNLDEKNYKNKILLAAGYPGEHNYPKNACYLYSQLAKSINQDGRYVYYEHTTTSGQSGMPLFQKANKKQQIYHLIGLHKGQFKAFQKNEQNKNLKTFGIIFNNSKKQVIAQIAEKMNIQSRLGVNYEPSKKILLKNHLKQQQEYDSIYINRLIDQNKYKQAFDITNQAVEQLKYSAFGDLARLYLIDHQNNQVKKNVNFAFQLATKGAQYQYANAYNILGQCYFYGYGVEKNQKQALLLFQKASNLGLASAQNALGRCYKYGHGVEKDYQKAVQLYKKAINQGNSNALNNLGDCFQSGDGVERNYQKAVQLYKKAIKQGNSNALNNLAICYCLGYGVEKNNKKALQLFQKAANMGHTGAQENVQNIKKKNSLQL